jgi:hypothetical protein
VVSFIQRPLYPRGKSLRYPLDKRLGGYSDGLRAGWPGFDSQHGKIFLFSTASRAALGPNQPPIQRILVALSAEVKRPGREADHSLPSSAEVKKGGAIPPLPNMSSWLSAYLIKHRDNFTLIGTSDA